MVTERSLTAHQCQMETGGNQQEADIREARAAASTEAE